MRHTMSSHLVPWYSKTGRTLGIEAQHTGLCGDILCHTIQSHGTEEQDGRQLGLRFR